jgi:hypothetical protein
MCVCLRVLHIRVEDIKNVLSNVLVKPCLDLHVIQKIPYSS